MHALVRSALVLCALLPACRTYTYDTVIRGGTIYDGTGGRPFVGDVAIRGDSIVAVGRDVSGTAAQVIDAKGMAVAPGFINMLSWATRTLLVDRRAMSDIKQGVTLEIFGEGTSMGPLNDDMKSAMRTNQGDLKFDVSWTTLAQYLEHLEATGVGINVASFVGATTLRIHEVGYANRAPTAGELKRMRALCRQAMQDGALGLGTSLIYAPAFYAKTSELVALAQIVGEYGGMYISHMRSEGNQLLEALDELIHIARVSGVAAEIYHLKAAGAANWPKLEKLIAKVEAARADGLKITADMYTYTAGSTGLDAAMPPWVQAGGYPRWRHQLQKPKVRELVRKEMTTPTDKWENLYLAAGGAKNVLLVGFKNAALKQYTGKTLEEVAKLRNKSPEDTAMDLVIEDGSRVQCVYFLMSEENVHRKIKLPWLSFCSDSGAPTPSGAFLKSNTHPRAYGSFARVIGKYCRDEKLIPLEEAIRKLTWLPASNLKLRRRGSLTTGNFADVVIFDPATVSDRATYDKPHQLAVGVRDVFVNGEQVLRDGDHTGALPGRVVRGPGYRR
jgi:N-acyl-D-amino-acid deacylase